MKGGKNRQPLGYTILEVMIVLAVSGIMFLIAASFISGKQERTAFVAGVNNMTAQLQDAIQQVTAGQYSDIPLTCTAGMPGNPPTFSGSLSPSQGTANRCVFVGKFFHFWTNDAPGGPSGPAAYDVFTLAGNRLVNGNPAVNLTDVDPAPVYGPTVNLTTQNTIPQTLDINTGGSIGGITVVDTSNSPHTGVYGFGFMESLGALATGGHDAGTYLSGSQTTNLVYSPHLTTQNQSGTAAIGIMSSPANPLAYAKAVTICLSDGTQYATISIGDVNSTNLNVTAHILGPKLGFGNLTCH